MQVDLDAVMERAAADKPLPVRQDTVGMFLDGYDFVSNNPPGFAISVAVEWAKENRVQF